MSLCVKGTAAVVVENKHYHHKLENIISDTIKFTILNKNTHRNDTSTMQKDNSEGKTIKEYHN